MIQYAVKISGCVNSATIYYTEAAARRAIREMEEADRVYDIPNPPRRCVVMRSVTLWRNVEEDKKQ